MHPTASSTFSQRFGRFAAALAAGLALDAMSVHAALKPFPEDFHNSQVVTADATIKI